MLITFRLRLLHCVTVDCSNLCLHDLHYRIYLLVLNSHLNISFTFVAVMLSGLHLTPVVCCLFTRAVKITVMDWLGKTLYALLMSVLMDLFVMHKCSISFRNFTTTLILCMM